MDVKLSRIQIFKRFHQYFGSLRLPMSVLMLCGLFAIPISLISPNIFQLFIDKVLGQGDMTLFPWVVIGLVLVFFIQVANDFLQLKYSNKIQNDFGYQLRKDIFSKYFRVSYIDYSKRNTNELKMRMVDDVDKLGNFIREQIVDYIGSIVTIIITVICSLLINWKYLLICLPVIPMMLAIDICIGRGTQRINEKIRKANEEYGAFEHNVLTMWKEIKVQCAEESSVKKYREYRNYLSQLGLVHIRYWLYREVFNDFKVNYLTKVLVYVIGAFLAIRGEVTVGTIILFGQYYEILFNATNTLNQRMSSFKANQPYYARICETLDWEEEDNEEKLRPESLLPIEFQHVSFSYDGIHNVVEDVSFSIYDRDKVVMAGSSGVGKSTIMSLALGLLRPQGGVIKYAGTPLEQIDKEYLYDKLGVVSQEGYLFNLTIRENLSLYQPDAKDSELMQVCKQAGIDEFISQLPEGLDTVIGEGGIKLSGGQRQRLLIARMLTKQPEFVCLDEATSALDEDTERWIVDGFTAQKQSQTVFAISHKPAMQRKFQRLLMIDDQHVYEKTKEEKSHERRVYSDIGIV